MALAAKVAIEAVKAPEMETMVLRALLENREPKVVWVVLKVLLERPVIRALQAKMAQAVKRELMAPLR